MLSLRIVCASRIRSQLVHRWLGAPASKYRNRIGQENSQRFNHRKIVSRGRTGLFCWKITARQIDVFNLLRVLFCPVYLFICSRPLIHCTKSASRIHKLQMYLLIYFSEDHCAAINNICIRWSRATWLFRHLADNNFCFYVSKFTKNISNLPFLTRNRNPTSKDADLHRRAI